MLIDHDIILVYSIRQTDEEFEQIQNGSSTERILVASTFVSQIRISFVVEHFVGRQIHAGVQNLKGRRIIVDNIFI